MSEKDFLTVPDIAQELGLTARTVRRQMRRRRR